MNSKVYFHKFGTIILLSVVITVGLYLSSLYNYLLFHTLAELFSIVIAFSIFVIAWNTRRWLENGYLLLIGTSFLFTGSMDLVHTLAYKGMPIFPGYDANLPTQLWIIARYIESISLLAASFIIGKRIRLSYVFPVYSAVSIVMLITVFLRIFPDCYIEGSGLTRFKIISEYVICLILATTIFSIFRNRNKIDSTIYKLLIAAITLTIVAELAFTFYISVYGISNMIGHIFKIAAFYLVYRAIIETGLSKPTEFLFRELKNREITLEHERKMLQNYLDIAGVILLVIGNDRKIKLINRKGCEVLECSQLDMIGKDWFTTFISDKDRDYVISVFEKLMQGEIEPVEYTENEVVSKSGRVKLIAWHNRIIRDDSGKIIGTLSSGQDITEQKKLERDRDELVSKLTDALANIRTLSGLLPICANCKKIRDDKGYWQAVETYIKAHSEADFTHSFCPECLKKLYPEFTDENK